MAAATGMCTLKPANADAFFFGPKIDPRWKGLVSQLKEYVTRTYIKYDEERARAALEMLAAYGVQEKDVTPLQNINRCLTPKGMFLTFFYMESATVLPVVKLFKIARTDTFDGFVAGGRKRTSLFGRRLESYDRVMLGEEIFSTADVPPVALPYNLAPHGASEPEWVIALPYGWVHDLYGRHSAGIEDRLLEELTIHEIAHIIHQTRDELIPFLAQFGYRMDDDRPMTTVDDLVSYLRASPLTYHQTERLILERVYYADAYYGSSGNSTHMNALKQIKDGLVNLTEEINRQDPRYPRSLLKMSDQQCYASMAFLYKKAVQRLAMANGRSVGPFT